VCRSEDGAIPLIVEDQGHSLLFPLSIVSLARSFKLAVSPIYYNAGPLLDNERAVDLIPSAMDQTLDFLRQIGVDYLSTCAPTFWPKDCVNSINSWFKGHNAGIHAIYAHMINTRDTTFDEILKTKFSKQSRNRIRKAEKRGVEVIKIDNLDGIQKWIDDIYRCNLSALRRQRRLGAYPDSYKDVYLSELLSSKNLLNDHFNIYAAIYCERLIAYMVIAGFNNIMQVNKAMSHASYLDKCPNDALVAHIAKDACEQGFEWFQYGWDRVKRAGRIKSLYASLQNFKFKFGFEEIPIYIYRLNLSRKGAMLKHLYTFREFLITRSASFPESIRNLPMTFYLPRRRRLAAFTHA
ncbi:hypothetical protein GTO27_11420, partial [Candidatus Bathyarchaeota archaeon]|nr:hypothetical protein [Candidatus Bathyarchaeota archaeon]